jgi:hypothetical protein
MSTRVIKSSEFPKWYEITIKFEAESVEDAHNRHDNAIDALCGCSDDIDAVCINFVGSMRPMEPDNDTRAIYHRKDDTDGS